jgi:hypothetical protein
MRAFSTVLRIAALVACAAGTAFANPARVCADPARPCSGFKAHDLSFPLAGDTRARAEQRSEPFFAVVLATAERCRTREKDLAEIQALFPAHKVFATRFECDDNVENNVTYTNVDAKHGFVAVYAGPDRASAKRMLSRVKATGRFPGANVRRMQVVFVHP